MDFHAKPSTFGERGTVKTVKVKPAKHQLTAKKVSFPAASWIEKQLVLLIDVLITHGRVTTVVTVPKPDKAANGQQLITSSSPRSQPVAIITKWVPMSLLRSSRKSCANDHCKVSM